MLIGKRGGGAPVVEVTVGFDRARWTENPSDIRRERVRAIIDTGATHVVMHPELIARLGLAFSKNYIHRTTGGRTVDTPGFGCDITIDRDIGPCTVEEIIAVSDTTLDCEVLLGWDFLRFFDLHFLSRGQFMMVWRGH